MRVPSGSSRLTGEVSVLDVLRRPRTSDRFAVVHCASSSGSVGTSVLSQPAKVGTLRRHCCLLVVVVMMLRVAGWGMHNIGSGNGRVLGAPAIERRAARIGCRRGRRGPLRVRQWRESPLGCLRVPCRTSSRRRSGLLVTKVVQDGHLWRPLFL